MRFPGAPSLAFLAYLLILLPWAAIRSSRRLGQSAATAELPVARKTIWINVIVTQAILLVLAILAGATFGFRWRSVPAFGGRELAVVLAALAICFGLRSVARAVRSEAERRSLLVYRIAPRARSEWSLWVVAVLAASIAEEAAYRGIGFEILWYGFGSPWAAALVSAMAFAAAHATQGLKSMAIVLVVGLVMQGVVAATGTLILAMAIHATYDFVAGAAIAREARAFDRPAQSSNPTT